MAEVQETIGQVLKRYRLESGYLVKEIELELLISSRHIEALEGDDFKALPADLYIVNFIKSYAKLLGLDEQRLLSLYEKQKEQLSDNLDSGRQENFKKTREIITPKRVKIGFLILIGILLLGYLGWQINQIFSPPALAVNEPADNIIIKQSYVVISGVTEKEARVFINNKEIYLGEGGKFSTTLDLQKGLNIIKISAQKKYSKEAVIYKQILVE